MTNAEKMGLINADEIRKAIAQLFLPGDVFECRILQKGRKKAISGYFQNGNDLIKALDTVDLRGANVYVTLQALDKGKDNALMSKEQGNHFVAGADSTADKDVKVYQWFFIDLDPVRRAGISSSEAELKAAYAKAAEVAAFMQGIGFTQPVKAVSGNGAHLLYSIWLDNTKEHEELVKTCLRALDYLFSDEQISVDTSVFNPSRICKLYGTLAQKGQSTKERPHRMSRLLGDAVLDTSEFNDIALMEKLAGMAPPEEEPARPETTGGYKEFDLEDWLNDHGIHYKRGTWKDGEKFVLDECPFDSSHRAPDSSIFRAKSGAIGFRCLHNSCQGKHWPDVRLMFEPDAYQNKDSYENDKRIEEGWKRHNAAREDYPDDDEEIFESAEADFQTMAEILQKPEPDEEYIRTGLNLIDRKMKGLQKKAVSVISGLRGAAKSTVLGQIALNAVQDGHRVLVYSGELSDKNYLRWILQQAAGKNHVVRSSKYEDFYSTANEVKQPIVDWLKDNLLLYNNTHGNDFVKVASLLRKKLSETKADLVILDNLMAFDLRRLMTSEGRGADKYDLQTAFVWALKDMAKKFNAHVIFVAHPRKASGLLRLDDISGSGNIANIVDNAFIAHRVNDDFKRLGGQMFKDKVKAIETNGYTNVIEICKDRENGTQDEFVGLYFERQSKRLLNDWGEYTVYGWEQDKPVTHSDPDEDNPF